MSERGRGEEASEGTIDLLVDFLADSPLIPVLSRLVVLWVFFASQSDVFLSPRNISNILHTIGRPESPRARCLIRSPGR